MVAIFTGAGAGFERSSSNLLGGTGQLGTALLGRGSENVSVNAANGNLLITQQDEFLVGLGPDAAVSRTYNSRADAADGDNGDNWQQNTTERVFGLTGTLGESGSTVSRLGSDGSVLVYTWDSARNAYVTEDGAGAFDTLTRAGDAWTWTDGGTQARETYEDNGSGDVWRIAARTDTDGNALSYSYLAGTDHLDKVTTADGSWIQYGWNGNNVTQITTGYTDLATGTESTLTRVRYGYDAGNRLTSVITDLTPEDNSVADGAVYAVTYTYDGSSNRVASISQSDGSLLQIGYDGNDRVESLTQTVSSGVTRVTSFAYGAGYTEVTGADGQVTRLDYDGAQRLTEITAPPASAGASAQTVQFSYDAEGNLATVTDGNGKVTSYGHDANGNTTSVTDPTGHTVERTYDAYNHLITELTYGSDASGVNEAHYAQYAYDASGNLRFAVNPAGQVTEYRYDASGNLVRTVGYTAQAYEVGASPITEAGMAAWVAGLGDQSTIQVSDNTYDARGNLTASVAYGIADASGNPLATEGAKTVNFVYDQAGNLVERYRPGETHETFAYDGMGRLIASSDKNGGTTHVVFDDAQSKTIVTSAGGYVTTQTYDLAGELIATSGSGTYGIPSSSSFQYDNLGRVRIATDSVGARTYTIYDEAGRKVGSVDDAGGLTEYRYDAANRLVATITYANALSAGSMALLSDPDNAADISTLLPASSGADVWHWNVYDDAGRLIETVDNLGSVAGYAYDQSGNLIRTVAYENQLTAAQLSGFKTDLPTAEVLPSGNAADVVTRTFYNEAGRQIGSLDGEGYLSEIVYDDAGRAVETIAYATASNSADRATGSFATLKSGVTGSSATDRTSRSVYDGQGLLRFTINALGGVTGYQYDDAGRVTATTVYATAISPADFTYAGVKAAIVGKVADRTSYVIYDPAGRAAYTLDAEGGVTAFEYDTQGNVTRTTSFDNLYVAGSLPSLAAMNAWATDSAQSADAKNRITRDFYGADGTLRFSVDAENYVTYYDYDFDLRLVETRRYADQFNAIPASITTAELGDGIVLPNTHFVSTFQSYDFAGRVHTTTDGEGFVTRNVYNVLGQLTDVFRADGTVDVERTHYDYDGAGRVSDQYSGDAGEATPQYLAHVHMTYDGLGNRTAVTDANGNVTAYAYDDLGRVTRVTNPDDTHTDYVYDAFDNVVQTTDPAGNATYSYYDALGRATEVVDAEKYVSKTIFDRFGDVLAVQKYATPFAGTPVIGTPPDMAGQTPTDLANHYYDKLGRVILSVDAEGYVETSAYNAFGQVVDFVRYATSSYDVSGGGATPAEIQAAYDQATQLQNAANSAQAAADQAAADADAAAEVVTTLQATADASQANANAVQATADQAATAAAQAQSAANDAQAAANAAQGYYQQLVSPTDVQSAYDSAADLQSAADAAQATADQAAADADDAAASLSALQTTAANSQASADALQATADQAASDAAQTQSDAADAQAAADAAWAYMQSLEGPSPAEVQAAHDAATDAQATADAAQADADQAAADAVQAQADADTAQAAATSAQSAYDSAVTAYDTAASNYSAAQNTANSKHTTSNNAAAAAASALTAKNSAATQLSQNVVGQAYANPIPVLQDYHDQLSTQDAAAVAYYNQVAAAISSYPPSQQSSYYLAVVAPAAQQVQVMDQAVSDVGSYITYLQQGHPLDATGKAYINNYKAFTSQQLSTYQTLQNNYDSAATAYNSASATAASALAAYNSAQANANQKLTLKNQAETAESDAQTALSNAQAAASTAQAAASDAGATATQEQADADSAQAIADDAWDHYNALAGGGNPDVIAAYEAATAAQQNADNLAAQATAAQAAASEAQTEADAALQAASDANALVADLEAQIAALGGESGTVSFEDERTAALADTNGWLDDHQEWLDDQKSLANSSAQAAGGDERAELSKYQDLYNKESGYVGSLGGFGSTTAMTTGYINAFFDSRTWEANNLGSDRSAALADPLAWLINREQDLRNWINNYSGVSSNFLVSPGNTIDDLKAQWVQVRAAIYELQNNSYSTGWPTSKNQINSFYNSGKNNTAYVPNGIQSSSSHTSDYRADIIINAYFDVGYDPAPNPTAGLEAQLEQAQADATAAQSAADTAQATADAAAASAAQALTASTQAQTDADAALAHAQQVEADAENSSDLQAATDAANAAQDTADADQALADQAATNAADAQSDADAAQAIADTDQAAVATAQATASEKAATAQQAQADADTAQGAADAALAFAQQLEAAESDPTVVQDALDAANQAQADASAAQAVADQAAADASTAQDDADSAQADADTAHTAVVSGQTAASQAAGAATQAQGTADTAQAAADAALLSAQQLEDGPPGGFDTSQLGAASETQFQYDERGQLTKSTDAEGFFETYTYNAFGQRTAAIAKSSTTSQVAGGTTTYTYDKRGLLLSETLPIQAYDSNGNAHGAIKNTYAYDGRGNLKTKVEADGLSEKRTTSYTYDPLDRLVTTAGDTVSGYTINNSTKAVSAVSGKPTETLTYDANGNVVTMVDAAGSKTVFFYDQLNRKTIEIDALGTYTAYTYNANGNVSDVKVYANTVSVPASGGAASAAPPVPSGSSRETTFTYDGLGRMLTSSVLGATTGSWNGSSWASTTAALTTVYQYDYLGNIVKLTDPNHGNTFSYYDDLGRKTAQVDAQGYLTAWTYDSEGHVLSERRYANRYTGTPDVSGPPTVSSNADDRITNYVYDKNGNRLSESRLSVKVFNGSTGTTTTTSTVSYLYNGLGEVTRKTEATGDQENYSYDAGGRLTQETRPSFTSNSGTVTPQVNYSYDGLGDLVRTIRAAAGDAGQAVSRNIYGAGGRLSQTIDAEGGTRNYSYDVAGRLVLETYDRQIVATGGTTTTAHEGIGYRYDVLGRNLGQAFYAKPGSSWTFQASDEWTTIQYDAFGEVTGTGVNGAVQQQNQYDLAGRVWASNSGDGVWKYFGYDGNGNQTVAITSAGTSLSGKTFAQALALISNTGVDGSYTVYDKRNLATSVVEEGRQLSDSSTQTLTTNRTYNAFGEVASETDALTNTTTYTYNTMGKMTRSESPTVQITLENGTTQWIKPSEDYYYDKSGRLVATRDANGNYATGGTSANGKSKSANTGNLTVLTLLAGTGYDGTQALVTTEKHADGGIKSTKYDVDGNARTITDEVGRVTTQTFDKLGHVIQVNHAGGLVDHYTYDVLGNRATHWNSQLGSTEKEITTYDIQGRVVSSRSFGGDVTGYSYTWDATIAASGIGGSAPGGWTQVTTMANGKTSTKKTDLFGRETYESDLGGHVTNYTYDTSGRLAKSQIGTTSYNYEYYNTGQVKHEYTIAPNWTYYTSDTTAATEHTFSTTTTQNATYTYDKLGNRLTEYGTLVNGSTTVVWKNETATYDALGRLASDTEVATPVEAGASVAFAYDANGNVRSKTSTYYYVRDNGRVDSQSYSNQSWYEYDSMNRVVLNNGMMSGSTIVLRNPATLDYVGDPSEAITYDKAGERTSLTINENYEGYIPAQQTPYGPIPASTFTYSGSSVETYTYDVAGRLNQVKVSDALFDSAAYIASIGTNATADEFVYSGPSTLRSQFTYDAMGHQTEEKGYATDGTSVIYDTTSHYNARGQNDTSFTSTLKDDGKTYTSSVTNTFGSGSSYALGGVVSSTSTDQVNGGSTKNTSTTNTFQWWDGAVQNTIAYNDGSGHNYTTSFTYNGLGQMTGASINDGMPRTVTFTLDEAGQIIRRDETVPSNAPAGQTGSPHEVWYYLGDRQIGYTGNNGGEDPSVGGSLRDLQQASDGGTFRGGSTDPISNVGFAQALDQVNIEHQGSSAGSYTVQAGDSLQGIAQKLYGDASLWYKLADANGLSGATPLSAGQRLTLPSGVLRNSLTNDSFRPYNPASAIGDLSPTTPAPPKHAGCGTFGSIILGALSAAIAIALPEIFPVFQGVAGGIGAAAIGNVVSQGVGIATGLQDGFSFQSLAMSALSAGIGGEIGPDGLNLFKDVSSSFARGALSQALGSALSQGIGVATGLQNQFDWAGVAASAVGGGAGAWAGTHLWVDGLSPRVVGVTAASIAGAATRSAIDGSSFGDALVATVPDIVGAAIGGLFDGRSAGQPQDLLAGTPYDDVPLQQPGTQVVADPSTAVFATQGAEAENSVNMNAIYAAGDELRIDSLGGLFDYVMQDRRGVDSGALQGFGDENSPLIPALVVNSDAPMLTIASGETATQYVPFPDAAQAEYQQWVKENGMTASPVAWSTESQLLTAKYLPSGYAAQGAADWTDFVNDYQSGRPVSLTLTYPIQEDVSWINQMRGSFLDSAAGAGFVQYANTMGFGIVGLTHGDVLDITESQHPYAATLGATIGFAGSLYDGGSLISGSVRGIALTEVDRVAIDAAESAVPLNTKVVLQGVTDRAVAELAADPSLARGLMSPGSYSHLVQGTSLAPASYGKAVERLSARIIERDPALSSILEYKSKPFTSTPDFFGYEGYNLRPLDITTETSSASHLARPYGPATDLVTHPGLPSNLVFPR